MAERLKPLREALDDLAQVILDSASHDETLLGQYGAGFPALNRQNISKFSSLLSEKIANLEEGDINPKFAVSPILERIEATKSSIIPNLWGAQGQAAFAAYKGLLDFIDWTFWPVYPSRPDWEAADADGMLPKDIAKKLRSQKAALAKTGVDIVALKEKIEYIEQAHQAALELPTDLESLREAEIAVQESGHKAKSHEVSAENSRSVAEDLLKEIKKLRDEATKLVENTEDAYSAATTKGLGEAFQQRADRLAYSMWVWVVGLMAALCVGAWLGVLRVHELQAAVNAGRSASTLWFNTLLAVFSIAAPVWFAWIATKQIGHRFRLSEDYAFKASVARAYEGYRREAARLDPAFANKLFNSALNRIDEAPIRFVEHETFGSPWHEVIKMRLARGRRGQAEIDPSPSDDT